MDEYFVGAVYRYSIADIDLSIERNRFIKLNDICKLESWIQQRDTWNALNFYSASEMLLDAIQFDIAYSSARITPKKIAETFHEKILEGFDENNSYCYSNWPNNHWRSENGSSWNPLTDSTFDMSIVFVKKDKILITCFISED